MASLSTHQRAPLPSVGESELVPLVFGPLEIYSLRLTLEIAERLCRGESLASIMRRLELARGSHG